MRKGKIFMIGWEYPPNITGGLAVACKEIARNLALEGYEIDFLLPRLTGNEEQIEGVHLLDISSGWEELSESDRESLASSRQWIEVSERLQFSPYFTWKESASINHLDEDKMPAPGFVAVKEKERKTFLLPEIQGGYGKDLLRDIHWFAQFSAILARKSKPDLIHAHDWMTFPAGIAAKESTGAPLIVHVHATEFDRCGGSGNSEIRNIEEKGCRLADIVISVSEYTKGILIDQYGISESKIRVAHNGVNLEEASLTDSVEKPFFENPIVLFLGRMTHQKGPDYFVKAARKIANEIPEVKFVMAGSGDLHNRMVELAADLGLGAHFHYTGFLDSEKAHALYDMSSVFIMPSVSEPFGLTALEAMSHNKAVILSKQSGVSEVVDQCIKVDFWDIDRLAEETVCILKYGPLREEIGRRARSDVNKLTWSATAKKITQVYRSIL
ncbi:glycosyltransferase family 1 protein [Leptospira langatensis]|uniref:Glycosyltransferase family 1 protein n=1 Tax=Leptospira langatensis TaxID=2484983 RepID=A0A5F1ZZI8_9LEPT|nr:glycosyltransferase family 4 protein [Leptospira langatensis]TGK04180.1 glycosyltransferase family 1 protein [Leptospira langatensis]TGL43660.1 glycosyltransferase family 1 protein [Leptospira langatensis]